MAKAEAHGNDGARAKRQQKPRSRMTSKDRSQTKPGQAAGRQESEQADDSLRGCDFSHATFQRHAALLGDVGRLKNCRNNRTQL